MNDTDKVAIVDAWIRRYSHPQSAEISEQTEWAYDRLDEICEKDPETCLEILGEICAKSNDDWVISNLGAGPLEDLLARHGESIISDVEARARTNLAFREALSVVWKNVISDGVWTRVERATKR